MDFPSCAFLIMKTVIIGLIFLALICNSNHIAYGQSNLVPNYSFEKYSFCPGTLVGGVYMPGYIGLVPPWLTPFYKFDTLGHVPFFTKCSSLLGFGVPQNNAGYQEPRTGNGYIEIPVYRSSQSDLRNYAEVKLLEPMIVGKRYCNLTSA